MSTTPSRSPRSPLASRSSPNLPFIVHSPTTVANALPPEIQAADRPLARQKRRRTSKEDEEILKAEYLKNPKPDKAARLEIVAKVALGEKEVQNRRQNDRRRSRPLDSSSSVLMSSSSLMSDPPVEDETVTRDVGERREKVEQDAPREQVETAEKPTAASTADMTRTKTETPPTEASPADVPAPKEASGDAKEPVEVAKAESQDTVASNTIASTDPLTADTAPTEMSSQSATSSQGASQPRTSWISNRRSASFVRNSEDYAPEVITFPSASQPASTPISHPVEKPMAKSEPSTKSLKRAHSFVRIATNEDGSARIVTDLDKTPSPPHSRTNQAVFSRAAAGLRRSYSSTGLNERLAAASEGRSPKVPRTVSNVGRSRDSRAWEFWCDPDSRYNTTLTTRAEQEGSGSAADAIGLLRANRRILAQNQTRQNTPTLSRTQSGKAASPYRVKKRGPMQRASTFSGRLQSKGNRKVSVSSESDDLFNTESDKENWEPEQQQSRRSKHAAQPLGSQRPRKILGENTEIKSQSQSLGAMMAREGTPRKGGNGSDPEQDDELRSFMGGSAAASARTTVSSAEEAGCVEGLLKLSQGQWR